MKGAKSRLAAGKMAVVTESVLEARLAGLCASVPDPKAGLFGPGSMRWRIDREAALFLGAGRALLLQLAHPAVAAAVAQHSRALDDPIGRFHGTFGTVFAMVFGDLSEALGVARRLHRRHGAIRGTTEGGELYAANEPAALQWVHATLIETALLAYGLALPVGAAERAGYYDESRRFAALFGLDPAAMPANWPEFAAYCEQMIESGTLAVGARARATAERLLQGAGSWIVVPPWYRAVTARMLPERLRHDFGLPYGAAERRLVEHALARISMIYPRLPGRLRFVGPYHEAHERMAGQAPSRLTRIGNRFWIGRPALQMG